MHALHTLTVLLLSISLVLAAPVPMEMPVTDTAPGTGVQAKHDPLLNRYAHQEVQTQVLEKRRGGSALPFAVGLTALRASRAASGGGDPSASNSGGFKQWFHSKLGIH